MNALRLVAAPARRASAPEPGVIVAAQQGDAAARAELVDHYARPVWALVCRILGRAHRREAAEDITQEALIAMLRSLPRYVDDGRGRFSAWVMTIAARAAIDELRSRRSMTVAIDVPADEQTRPDRLVEQQAVGEAIATAIEALTPEFRAAFVLRAYHDLDYVDIAAALGIDVGTVKSRLWRARAQLQRALAEVRDER